LKEKKVIKPGGAANATTPLFSKTQADQFAAKMQEELDQYEPSASGSSSSGIKREREAPDFDMVDDEDRLVAPQKDGAQRKRKSQ